MLAGLVRREIAEASDLFAQAMKESGLEALSRPDAARVYAVAVSKQIISGEITPQYGATRLWEASIRVGDPNFHELDTFIYAASELQTRPEDKDFFNKEIMREAEAWTSKSDF
jgi:predicted solute-binding protein